MKKLKLSILFLLSTLMVHASMIETQKRNIGEFTSIRSTSSIDLIVEQSKECSLEVTAPAEYMENIITEVNNGQLSIYIEGSIRYSGSMTIHIQVKELSKIILTGSGDFETAGKITTPELLFRMSGSGDMIADFNCPVVNGSLSGSGDAQISGITKHLDIQQSGSGDLIATELFLLTAKLRMNGSGDCKFKGNSDDFDLTQSGSGDFSGRDFEVENAQIRKTSSGDTRVVVVKNIETSISGSGDLYYSGNPSFQKISITGSGDIIKLK